MKTNPVSIILLLFIMVFPNWIYAQHIPHRFTTWTQSSGLSQSTIFSIIRDHQGFIWAATQDGLNRFDGYEFTVFKHSFDREGTISNNWIWNIYEDNHNNLWIATMGGLNLYRPELNKFTEINPKTLNGKDATPLQTNFIFQENDTLIWITAWGQGIYWLNPETGTFYDDHLIPDYLKGNKFQYIRTVFKDYDGNILLGTWGNGLINVGGIDRNSNDPTKKNSYHVIIPDIKVTSIAQEISGRVWVGTNNQGLYIYHPDSLKNQKANKPENLQVEDDYITALHIDGNDKLWIGTHEKGLYIYDLNTFLLIHCISEPYLVSSIKSNFITAIYEDNTEKIWLGSNGLALYDAYLNQFGVQYSTGKVNELKDPVVWCFEEESDSTIWIGTESGGLFLFDPKSGFLNNFSTLNSNISSNNIRALQTDRKNRLWIGHFSKGIEFFEPEKMKFTQIPGLENIPVKDFLLSNDDWLWIGTIRNGIYKYHITKGYLEKLLITKNDDSENLNNITVNSFHSDSRGFIWVSTLGNGILIFDSDNNLISHLNTGNFNGLISNLILAVYEDNEGNHWVGSSAGIMKIRKNHPDTVPFGINLTSFNDDIPGSLSNQVFYAVKGDKNSGLWLSTNMGLIRYSPTHNTVQRFGPEEGIQSYEFNTNASYALPNGLLFFGGMNGFNYFYPESIITSEYTPPAKIIRLYLEGRELNPDSIKSKGLLRLKHRQNNLVFEFTVFDFPTSSRNKFKTQLAGLDEKWHYQDTRRFINYAGLPPGEYTLRVNASNKYGAWGENPDIFTFIIRPPFWRTWWFFIIIGAVFSSMAYLWHISRLQKAIELEKLRIRISSDLHDDLGASLTRISLYSQLLKNEKKNKKNTEYLDKIGLLSRQVITSMSDIVWAIDARNDNLAQLIERIKGLAHELTTNLDISVHFNFSADDENIKLSPQLRQNIYLICKEAVQNAVKHSGCNNIEISLKKSSSHIIMSITDNGKGFDVHSPSRGNGISNMYLRAKNINGDLTIESPGKGTLIQFLLRL